MEAPDWDDRGLGCLVVIVVAALLLVGASLFAVTSCVARNVSVEWKGE